MNSISQFNFSALPTDLKNYILAFAEPTDLNPHELKITVRNLVMLMNKRNKSVLDKKIQELFVTCTFSAWKQKYSRYNGQYELNSARWNELSSRSFSSNDPDADQRFLEKFNPIRRPQLLDALSTGCRLPYAYHSVSEYTPDVEQDIKEMVQLMPESLDCRVGCLRLRDEVPPLGMACMNPNIPVSMVDWLLEHGANANETWSGANDSSRQVGIALCLKYDDWCGLGSERTEALVAIFEKHGARTE
jgi:hypothetical protein